MIATGDLLVLAVLFSFVGGFVAGMCFQFAKDDR